MTPDPLQTAALDTISEVRTQAGDLPGLGIIASHTREFYRDMAEYEQNAAAIRADVNLSSEGKRSRLQPLTDAWKAKSADTVAAIEREAKDLETRHAYAPPAPTADPMLLEAQLANARSDARMMLDDAATADVPTRMAQLLKFNADPLITYLLTGTTWADNYIRSRSADTRETSDALHVWEKLRADTLPATLDDAGRQKLRAAQAVKSLTKTHQIVNATRHFYISDNNL